MKPPETDPAFEVSLRPPAFSEFTGQMKVRERLELMVAAAKKRNDVLEHILLSGPSGLGKTTLAYIIANAMGAPLSWSEQLDNAVWQKDPLLTLTQGIGDPKGARYSEGNGTQPRAGKEVPWIAAYRAGKAGLRFCSSDQLCVGIRHRGNGREPLARPARLHGKLADESHVRI